MIPILLHGSYTPSIDDLFEMAWKYGYDGVEMTSPGCRQKKDEIESGMLKILELKEKFLLKDIILHFPVELLSDSQWESREELFDRLDTAFSIASKKLGCRIFNTMAAGTIIPEGNKYTDYHLNGSAAATDIHWERAVEMLQVAGDLAGKYGIKLVVETHGCLIHDTVDASCRIIKEVNRENVRINLDIPNIELTKNAGHMAIDEFEDILPFVEHVHLKNLRSVLGGGALLENVSNGEIDYSPLFSKLIKNGYKGSFSLEFPGRYGNLDSAAAKDVLFVRDLQLKAFSGK